MGWDVGSRSIWIQLVMCACHWYQTLIISLQKKIMCEHVTTYYKKCTLGPCFVDVNCTFWTHSKKHPTTAVKVTRFCTSASVITWRRYTGAICCGWYAVGDMPWAIYCGRYAVGDILWAIYRGRYTLSILVPRKKYYVIQVCWQQGCQQTCMTYTVAVFTVKNSWWWTEELSETCRVFSKNKFEKLVHLVGFIIRIYHGALSSERKRQCEVWSVCVLIPFCLAHGYGS